MIKGYIKRRVDAAVMDLSSSVSSLRRDVDGVKGGSYSGVLQDDVFGYGLSFARPGLKDRVTSLEQKVDLLLKHLNLCKTDVPAKTVLKKCKEAK